MGFSTQLLTLMLLLVPFFWDCVLWGSFLHVYSFLIEKGVRSTYGNISKVANQSKKIEAWGKGRGQVRWNQWGEQHFKCMPSRCRLSRPGFLETTAKREIQLVKRFMSTVQQPARGVEAFLI